MSRVVEIHPVDTEEVVLLRLNGQEWVKPGELAKVYGVEVKKILELVDVIAQSHQMRVRELGPRSTVVNLLDFRRGLVAVAPVRNGYVKGGL